MKYYVFATGEYLIKRFRIVPKSKTQKAFNYATRERCVDSLDNYSSNLGLTPIIAIPLSEE